MRNEEGRCQAITQAGHQCKNRAQTGSSYCHVHQDTKAGTVKQRQAEDFNALIAEINTLAADVRQLEQAYSPPPFTARGMVRLLKQNLDKFTPEMRMAILGELQQSLEGSSPRDALDPDTWRGMWYLLNYSVQHNTAQLRERLGERVASIPGLELMNDLQASLEGASARDFMDIDTWKGIWYMVNYSLRFETNRFKDRLLGETDEPVE